VAAFIAEPVQGGGGGVIVPPEGYFRRVREICDRHDVLFISDDVITGFGRTGRWFGLEHWGGEPDIVQFAKGVTSGYVPLGGVGVSARIKSVLDAAPSARRWWHGYTYSGHPVACAVALANIRVIQEEGLVSRAEILGRRLRSGLTASIGEHPNVGEVRGIGLLAGIELVADRGTKEGFDADAQVPRRLRTALRERGLVTRVLDNAICLAPPFVTTEDQVDRIVEIVTEAARAVFDRPATPAWHQPHRKEKQHGTHTAGGVRHRPRGDQGGLGRGGQAPRDLQHEGRRAALSGRHPRHPGVVRAVRRGETLPG
jgi:adenosylmethionine-8-amino-7-oxononanoate aminotransferase